LTPADALVLAAEIPAEHPVAQLALPLGFLFFSGSVYLLLWSVYGAKKGALVYGTAFFAFSAMIGVFWWFGAPGSPQATGVRYFPGQEVDRYVPRWYPMEPGSERAQFFEATNDFDLLETPEEHLGLTRLGEEDLAMHPAFRDLIGDVDTAASRMVDLYLPVVEGSPRIGPERRGHLLAEADRIEAELEREFGADEVERAEPFFTARVKPDPDDPTRDVVRVTEERGLRVAGAELEVLANWFVPDPETGDTVRETRPVEEAVWFAFKDPGALWFPSALWTLVSLVLFLLCLVGLDALEAREKRRVAEREPVRT
jgi:hypothetical protein